MALQFYLTNVGKQAAIDAANNSLVVKIKSIVFAKGKYDAATQGAGKSALTNPLSPSFDVLGGGVVGGTLRFTTMISPAVTDTITEIGLILESGVLFAVASHPSNTLIQLISGLALVLTVGVRLDDITTDNVTVNVDANSPIAIALMNGHQAHLNPHPQYAQISNINSLTNSKVDKTTAIIAGVGLSGGGDLSVNRTLQIADKQCWFTSLNLDNTDLNTLTATEAGIYHQTDNIKAKLSLNYPVEAAGTLVVMFNAGVTQEYTTYASSNRKFIRGYVGGVWGAWEELAKDNDTRIANGQTAFEWGNHANAGYATTGGVGGAYLPLAGGTVTGNLVVNSNYAGSAFFANASQAGFKQDVGNTKYLQFSASLGLNDNFTISTNQNKIKFNKPLYTANDDRYGLEPIIGDWQSFGADITFQNTSGRVQIIFARISRGSESGGSGFTGIRVWNNGDMPAYTIDGSGLPESDYTVFYDYNGGYTVRTVSFVVPNGWSYFREQTGLFAGRRRVVTL